MTRDYIFFRKKTLRGWLQACEVYDGEVKPYMKYPVIVKDVKSKSKAVAIYRQYDKGWNLEETVFPPRSEKDGA